jgi:hypothetical protein
MGTVKIDTGTPSTEGYANFLNTENHMTLDEFITALGAFRLLGVPGTARMTRFTYRVISTFPTSQQIELRWAIAPMP